MRWLLLVLLLPACRRAGPTIAATDGEVYESTVVDPAALPRVRTLGDIATHHRKRVVVEGSYEIDPLAPGKRKGAHFVWIVLSDGTRVSRAYRAIPEELGLAGHRVEVTGTITSGPPDPQMQSLLAPHIIAEHIALPNGDKPDEVTTIPAPPIVSASPPLGARIDRWVQIVGTLSSVATLPTADAKVTLADGGVVRVEGVDLATWSPLVGTTVTVTGRLAMEKGAGAFGLDFVIRGETAICAGSVSRCGM